MLSTLKTIWKRDNLNIKNEKYDRLYMDMAKRVGEMSYAKRRQVGCIIEKDGRIISMGWNGMPAGWDNECEDLSVWKDGKQLSSPILVTKDEVLHAESNAIAKLAKSNESGQGATLYVTCAPCIHCAKLIHQSGISKVIFLEEYHDDYGIVFLQKSKVETFKL